MKLAIMQPYFLPYIGYFQLIRSADVLVLYDNIKYTKKGWINRNRILQNQAEAMVSLPLKSDSDHLDIVQRSLADSFDRAKMLRQFQAAYRAAPFFAETWPLLQQILDAGNDSMDPNLFGFLHRSIVAICRHLGLRTRIVVSSSVAIDHQLKGEEKVLALCQALGATHYINAIGGQELYARAAFAARHIELHFIRSRPLEYAQFGNAFIPWLSIVDVMMFNGRDQIMADVIDA